MGLDTFLLIIIAFALMVLLRVNPWKMFTGCLRGCLIIMILIVLAVLAITVLIGHILPQRLW